MPVSRTRVILGSTALVLMAGASLYAFNLTEQFLIRDKRFRVATPDGGPDQVLQITGVSHASLRAIETIFQPDFGQSLYLVPIDERLAAIRNVDWVRDASVARVWPNRLLVNIVERTPVAFIRLPNTRFALIDAEGVILPPAKDQFFLPVLLGVRSDAEVAARQNAVDRMTRLASELGESVMKDVSEIDVADPDNIAITVPHNGHIVKLQLGDRNYSDRYQTFLKHAGDIDAKVPGARVMDLRLEDRITVVEAE
jgi:cell division protein FtsQ